MYQYAMHNQNIITIHVLHQNEKFYDYLQILNMKHQIFTIPYLRLSSDVNAEISDRRNIYTHQPKYSFYRMDKHAYAKVPNV